MSSRVFRASAGALLVALASYARAEIFCVDLNDGSCNVIYTGSAGLASALAAAALTSTNDTVTIGTGTYLGPFTYMPSGDAGTLAIIGSGIDQTTLSVPFPGSTVPAVLTLARDVVGHPASVSRHATWVRSSTPRCLW